MSFGADCLINKLNGCIAGLGADITTACDYAQVGGSLNSLENASFSVPNLNSLPSAQDNEGRFVYVEDIKSFRYSDGYLWTKDACSVLGDPSTNAGLWSWGGFTVNDTCRCSPGTTIASNASWCWVDASSSGGVAVMAIKTDGTLWTRGSNGEGILGDGTTIDRCSPGTVAGGGTTWCQVSVSNRFAAALKTDGTLWTWGCNRNAGLLGNGGVEIIRCSPGTVAGGGTTWCQIRTAYNHTSAVKTDGTLWTWGCNSNGILGDGTTVCKCSPGTVAGGGTTWCQVSNGFYHSMAIKTDGTLWTWGCNNFGQLGEGTVVSRCSPGTVAGGGTTWCQISSGRCHGAAIKTDGTLWTWGSNFNGVLGNGFGSTDRCSPGTVAGGGTTWCRLGITAAITSAAAIKTDGTLWTWGGNQAAALGDGTITARCSPGTVIGSGNLWCMVTGGLNGNSNMFAIRTRGF